ncbi:MAG TPA: PIN domain nuclease [Stellaceae bacterium]|nr:PIN domain nuclease [Stellaceae bacterium]
MIVVDSSVWIDHFNRKVTRQVGLLRSIVGQAPILVGDLILCEVLQGARNDHDARRLANGLKAFETTSMLNPEIAVRAASNYRRLRGIGLTVRKTIDLIIGTFCIERTHTLLHDDRDFDGMAQHLGLRVL